MKKILVIPGDGIGLEVIPATVSVIESLGLKIEFIDPYNGSTIVSSDYGIVYYQTKMVSLEGNVKILSPDGASILSPQIYWDPDEEWLFTEKNIVFSGNDYDINASKFDADKSFSLLRTGQLNGNFLFEDN